MGGDTEGAELCWRPRPFELSGEQCIGVYSGAAIVRIESPRNAIRFNELLVSPSLLRICVLAKCLLEAIFLGKVPNNTAFGGSPSQIDDAVIQSLFVTMSFVESLPCPVSD